VEQQIDTPSFKPLYQQVKQLLITRLTDRVWEPGELLPSESQLAAEFGVSQGTVRKALDEMTVRTYFVDFKDEEPLLLNTRIVDLYSIF